MEHIAENDLYAMVFDGTALPSDLGQHLTACPACREQVAALELLATELRIARRSMPSPAALARYADLFTAVARQPSPLQQIWQRVRATLTWDSRQQLALQGVRSDAPANYRLLYSAPPADVELLVAPGPHTRQIEGEVVAEAQAAAPALVQLIAVAGGAQHEAETDDYGRFSLDDVAPGVYAMTVTLAGGQSFDVDDLELT